MKTILFYTDTPNFGGAENQMYLLAKFLNKEKYKVLLVCSDYKKLDDWTEKFFRDEMEVIRLNVVHKHDPRHYFQLLDIIKQNDIDLAHLHVWNPASCRYAFKAVSKYNIPTVITEHDPFKLPKIKHFIKDWLLKKINHIIAVSDSNNELMVDLFPQIADKITTIHNGIDVTWFHSQLLSFNESKAHEYRKEHFDADKDTKVILTVAELHERKGVKHLIKTLPHILEKKKDVRLVIAGDGPQKMLLQKIVQDEKLTQYVKFMGFRKDIPKIMAASDVFVLPSQKEAFGLVILEAMAAQLPIVASNVGGIPEIIDDGVNGSLVNPVDHEIMAEKILELFNNDLKITGYIRAASEKLQNEFDAKMMAKKTEKIYDNILT